MCWKLAYDETYSEKELPLVAHQCYNEKPFNTLVYLKLMEVELVRGVDGESLEIFTEVTCQCLAETRFDHPTMEFIINQLTRMRFFQVSISL
ncbi:hypothetical protein Hanom_Chr11g01051231 [Helianthus anomalus]